MMGKWNGYMGAMRGPHEKCHYQMGLAQFEDGMRKPNIVTPAFAGMKI
jgi:hypothetical protein